MARGDVLLVSLPPSDRREQSGRDSIARLSRKTIHNGSDENFAGILPRLPRAHGWVMSRSDGARSL